MSGFSGSRPFSTADRTRELGRIADGHGLRLQTLGGDLRLCRFGHTVQVSLRPGPGGLCWHLLDESTRSWEAATTGLGELVTRAGQVIDQRREQERHRLVGAPMKAPPTTPHLA